MDTKTTEPPLCLTRDGAYVWAQAAALRAHDAGDKRGRNQAWSIASRHAAGRTLDELLQLDREARALVDGVTVQPMTEEQAREAKRGTQVRDNKGRVFTKAIRLWHRYASRSDSGERVASHELVEFYGPIWPVRGQQ